MTVREPLLNPIAIEDLRPTQITLGLREVAEKRKEWRTRTGKGEARYLGQHMIPIVLGPKKNPYVIDHHHLARALHGEGVKRVLITVIADLSALSRESFWIYLDNRSWCHPYDQRGRRRDFDDIPASIADMLDDPYRSLAGALRRAGGFAKDTTPFSEFLWADFLRRLIRKSALEKDFKAALQEAITLSKGKDASYLPGWCGPDNG